MDSCPDAVTLPHLSRLQRTNAMRVFCRTLPVLASLGWLLNHQIQTHFQRFKLQSPILDSLGPKPYGPPASGAAVGRDRRKFIAGVESHERRRTRQG